ncbi:multiple antibiotic resistance (MarC)-related protein [Thalassoporum mexicanum PCC 7367]|uniref:MarC family protein n=1 Tax=Thalassoporum mexicanum TaxID=3457544 RepID=UPI00029FA8B0|nr:MarC family protein [Pseudanabaena sp. PCC 7367]AFY70427.1 multiple antibiotic resistance (MarC)-related protein [Pseudanabaena sp. PCC 7367]
MLQPLLNHAIGTMIALIPIANPIGAIPIFYTLTTDYQNFERGKQARSTAINVAGILVAFFLAGKFILQFFGISLGVLQIAGGLIVAHTAWEMVTTKQRLKEHEHQEALEKEDISFTPMAMPMISGPGAIGVVIGLSERAKGWQEISGSMAGLVLFGLVTYLLLALGQPLIKALGKNGLGALNRVMGFFVLAIAVQLVTNGVLAIVKEAAPKLLH